MAADPMTIRALIIEMSIMILKEKVVGMIINAPLSKFKSLKFSTKSNTRSDKNRRTEESYISHTDFDFYG